MARSERTGDLKNLPKYNASGKVSVSPSSMYSNFRNYAPPLDEKGGIITEKVVPVFSESFFGACFGMVM